MNSELQESKARELAIRALDIQNPRFTLYRNQDPTHGEDVVRFWTARFKEVLETEYTCKCGIRVEPHRCNTGTEF